MQPIQFFFDKIVKYLPNAKKVAYHGVWCNGTIQFRVEMKNNYVVYFSTKDGFMQGFAKL